MATIDVTGLPEDKVRHLENLIENWRKENAQGIPPVHLKEDSGDTLDQAWQEFFQIGDTLAKRDTPDADTLTSAVLSMRR